MKLLFDARLPGAYLLSLTPEEAGKLSVILDIYQRALSGGPMAMQDDKEAEFAANARREIMGEPICNVVTIPSGTPHLYKVGDALDYARNRLAKLIEDAK